MKKIVSLILCGAMLLCLTSCDAFLCEENTDVSSNNSADVSAYDPYDKLFGEPPSVFVTENIERIVFYSYYGSGVGSKVPIENMAEITQWLESFTIIRKATNEEIYGDGHNMIKVKITYADGTIIKEGLAMVWIDDTAYMIEGDPEPACYKEIISKARLN